MIFILPYLLCIGQVTSLFTNQGQSLNQGTNQYQYYSIPTEFYYPPQPYDDSSSLSSSSGAIAQPQGPTQVEGQSYPSFDPSPFLDPASAQPPTPNQVGGQSTYPSLSPTLQYGQMNPSPITDPATPAQPPQPLQGGGLSGGFMMSGYASTYGQMNPSQITDPGTSAQYPPTSQDGVQNGGYFNMLPTPTSPGSDPSSSNGPFNQSIPASYSSFQQQFPNPIYQNYPPNYQVSVANYEHFQVPPLSHQLPIFSSSSPNYSPSYQSFNYKPSGQLNTVRYKPVLVYNQPNTIPSGYYSPYPQYSGYGSPSQEPTAQWNPLDDIRHTSEDGNPSSISSSFPSMKVPMVHYHSSLRLNYDQKPTTWRHNHASHWYGICATGQEQSPIDIDTYSVIDLLQNEEFPLLDFHETMTNGTLENDGHTVRFLPSQEFKLKGGGLEGEYKLAELNFRWCDSSIAGSEHTFDKQASPMELQFFFHNTNYEDFSNSTKYVDGVAALAVLFDLSLVDNEDLNPIIHALPAIRTGDWKITSHGQLKLRNLLPVDTKSFYRYFGSMTTPPCQEAVTWTVFNEKLTISENQLRVFRSLMNYEGQYLGMVYRPVQRLNHRSVHKNQILT